MEGRRMSKHCDPWTHYVQIASSDNLELRLTSNH